ncbi:MAG TPA: outer membrane protein transport protein [Polyangiaceae bacterium]|jgi:long-chain fatty acid transport protein
MRRAIRVSAAAVLALAALSPRVARATSVEEFPDNGSEQEGRGGAWVARASDPLATFYNPAGLAGQPTRLTLQANISSQHTCFQRVQSANDPTSDGYSPASPGGTPYPKVCSSGAFFPDPQLAFTYHLSDRIGLGLALLAPSAVGAATWPQFVDGNPAPQRYMLISTNSVILTPTIGVGWEVVDGLRLGASFIFGTAPSIDFVNAAPGINESPVTASNNDIRNELKAKDIFFPGFTLGAIWSPSSNLDVAAWYKWMSSVNAKGDVTTASNDFTSAAAAGHTSLVQYGDTAEPYCYTVPAGQTPAGPPLCGSGNNGKVTVPIPMEAKLGVRYHKPRPDLPYDGHLRDPMTQDVFDVEADVTWANNSAFDAIQIRFPGAANGSGIIPANPGISSSFIPPNADVTHAFRDAVGVRLGGDYNLLPDQLAIRAGAFFETQAANSVYQNIDFDGADRFGVALGGTYRIRMGSEKQHALDLMAGYGHVFFGTLSNDNPNAQGLPALVGTACLNNGTAVGSCPGGGQTYRTPWPINLGTITSSINVINVGASYKF